MLGEIINSRDPLQNPDTQAQIEAKFQESHQAIQSLQQENNDLLDVYEKQQQEKEMLKEELEDFKKKQDTKGQVVKERNKAQRLLRARGKELAKVKHQLAEQEAQIAVDGPTKHLEERVKSLTKKGTNSDIIISKLKKEKLEFIKEIQSWEKKVASLKRDISEKNHKIAALQSASRKTSEAEAEMVVQAKAAAVPA